MESRSKILAKKIVNYSVSLKPKEKILIESFDNATTLVDDIITAVYEAGGVPFVSNVNSEIHRTLLKGASVEQLTLIGEWEAARMRQMDAYVGIRASNNVYELSDVPVEQIQLYNKYWVKKVNEIRVPRTKWCVLRYPNAAMSQLANMSRKAFSNFYFAACNLDYQKMDNAMDALVTLMNNTDEVKITGPNTNLKFSIKGIPAVKCSGHHNLPDGEVFTAPVRNSINGKLTYNTNLIHQGKLFNNICLEFSQGKIIKATANDTENFNKILDTDEGARYIGEFAIGVNPYITSPINDTLFDEKIDGSFHFTPGEAYESADNGNRSAVHIDIVSIQKPAYGGGEIWFDNKLIRKDGLFVTPELLPLNPENLID